MSEAMIVSPLPWVHLHADWSEQGLDSYRLLREQRRDGLRSVSPSVGRRSLAKKIRWMPTFPFHPSSRLSCPSFPSSGPSSHRVWLSSFPSSRLSSHPSCPCPSCRFSFHPSSRPSCPSSRPSYSPYPRQRKGG